jgi:hypothetical protein
VGKAAHHQSEIWPGKAIEQGDVELHGCTQQTSNVYQLHLVVWGIRLIVSPRSLASREMSIANFMYIFRLLSTGA